MSPVVLGLLLQTDCLSVCVGLSVGMSVTTVQSGC